MGRKEQGKENKMRYMTEILNWVSASFLLPDLVLLFAAMLFALVELGGFCSTYLMLLRQRRRREELMNDLRSEKVLSEEHLGHGVFARHLAELMALKWDPIHCEKRIFDFSRMYEHELERARFLMKIGPMLGLMGTLIPMGPALAGLASGDIGSMAYNMQIAFGTTVVGIFVAGVGLLLYSVKRHWFADEISCLQYALDLKCRSGETTHEKLPSL